MSQLRNRLARALGNGGDPAEVERLTRRLDELDTNTRAELDRHESLIRDLGADLTERVAAIERRIAALEARVQ